MTMPGPEVESLAEGLWRRLRDVLMAERQLERFVFAPEGGREARVPGRLPALVDDHAALTGLARDVTLRALAAAADGVNYRVLASIGGDAVGLDELARAVGLPALAASERVNALAQVGLAARDLERDAVVGTAAGRGVVALVEAISAELAARCRAAGPSP